MRSSGTDVLINLTTGPGARFVHDPDDPTKAGPASTLRGPQERVRHVVELRPEICSLDMGRLNMGSRVFINTPEHLQTMAVAIRDAAALAEKAAHIIGVLGDTVATPAEARNILGVQSNARN